jgi:acetylornithine deacetylase/succinyl-diaminopimelate desuccinylase-like protein
VDDVTARSLTPRVVELLQAMIRAGCVNDGTPTSGHEHRNAAHLRAVLEGPGLELATYEPTPGRTSLVARLEGTDPDAPSLCLMGHTDVVPANPDGWREDPFGGELVDGEIWGRGAVDMLNLTAAMAVAVRHLADRGFRPRGDLIFLGVADEEAGSAHGAAWLADHHWDEIGADHVLTESGGYLDRGRRGRIVTLAAAEKGFAWRRLTIRGTPGHGSSPYRSDNALVTAAEVVRRLAEYRPVPRVTDLWRRRVEALPLDDELRRALLDPGRIDTALSEMPGRAATHFHACTHTTFSPNVVRGGSKTNTIPDRVDLELDVRTLPGETDDDVAAHLRVALGDLADRVEVSELRGHEPSASPTDTPLWRSLERRVAAVYPDAEVIPNTIVGFTDARVYRERGAVAYGAGLFSPAVSGTDFGRRFHGNDERIDVDSLRLTTDLYLGVVEDLLG